MSTVYQVKRPEPLPVNSVQISILETLDSLAKAGCAEYSCINPDNRLSRAERCDGRYLRAITAKFTGRETSSEKPIAIGYIKAVFVKEKLARHSKKEHKGSASLE